MSWPVRYTLVMTTATPFRFGLQLHSPIDGMNWLDSARYAEDQGYDTLLIPDHFHHQYGPLTSLAAAAAVTTNMKVAALVFGNDYRHPVVLAKEMATLDLISGGRVEFGLGAGWMRTDYSQAGMVYDRPGVRIERLVESLDIVRRCWSEGPFDFDGEHYTIRDYDGLPKPHRPGGPPVIVGGGGPRMLGVAARNADIVAVTANLRAGEVGPDAIADSMGAAYDAKLARFYQVAGPRAAEIELSSLTMNVAVTDDRDSVLATFVELFGKPAEEISQSPALLIGSVAEIIETLQARRERWGFSYIVVQQSGSQGMNRFGEVVAALSGT